MTINSTLLTLGALMMMAGCASKTPAFDRQFGSAVLAARQAQTINPTPSPHSVAGVDGKAGKSAYDAYQKSYKEPQPQTGALSIGVGR